MRPLLRRTYLRVSLLLGLAGLSMQSFALTSVQSIECPIPIHVSDELALASTSAAFAKWKIRVDRYKDQTWIFGAAVTPSNFDELISREIVDFFAQQGFHLRLSDLTQQGPCSFIQIKLPSLK